MTSPFKQFATDEALEKEGIVLDYGDYAVKIKRAGGANRRFAQVLEAKQKPHRRQIQNETLPEDVARKLLAEAYAEAVILNWGHRKDPDSEIQWGHLPDEEGNLLPCTPPHVVATLIALPEWFADIREQASKVALFRRQEIEDTAGNSAAA